MPAQAQAQAQAGTVHPRVCGELFAVVVRACLLDGSSPRVRGTPARRNCRRAGHRFIPACAGNSTVRGLRRRTSSVHPRVCGELRNCPMRTAALAGSSPRVRGTPCRPQSASAPRRFIPACAGNSAARIWIRSSTTVHPRVCGELAGPRRRQRPRLRFIPACAGNSPPAARPRPALSVHPRVCGELSSRSARAVPPTGSSPRVRGTRPAAALRAPPPPVHPRVCGELHSNSDPASHIAGSSPRVRGTHFL